MFGYCVEMKSYCDHSEHSGEQYGDWSESWSNDLGNKVKKIDKNSKNIADIASSLDIQLGKNAFVVWLEYSSGDSFGYATDKYTEVLGIFEDVNAARELQQFIENFKDGHEFSFTTSDGQTFKQGFASWTGYFDSVSRVVIDVVTVI